MDRIFGLLPWAFSAGMVATLNPCGFAMLPAYLSYLVGRADGVSLDRQIARGALAGAGMTAGVVGVFLAAGAVVSALGSVIARFVPWIGLAVGVSVAAVGLMMFFRPSLNPMLPVANPAGDFVRPQGRSSFVVFGAGYGLASLGCTLPIFLVVTAQALAAGGFVPGLVIFFAYALGMGSVLLALSVAAGTGSGLLVRFLRRFVPFVRWVGAAGMVAAGGYLIYYQLTFARFLFRSGP